MAALLLQIGYATCTAYAQVKTAVIQDLSIPDSTHVQILTTRDGSTNIGRIVEITANEIQFETGFGTIAIAISRIQEIKEVPASSIRDGQYWFPNPNATRLYFAPTARMLKQGEGYIADYWLFFPAITYGMTDHITIGAGMSLFPGDEQMFYFTPKVGLRAAENLNLAAGALLVKLPAWDDDDASTAGILYGVCTYGTSNGSITAGFGYGFVDGDVAEKPMIMIGGERRLSRRTAFVTENWIFPEVDQPIVSYGFRFFGEAISVDLALVTPLGEDATFPGIPFVDFVFNF